MKLVATSSYWILGLAIGLVFAGCGTGSSSEAPSSGLAATQTAKADPETAGFPPVAAIREVTPEEFDDVYESCMAEDGWVLSLDEFGQSSIELAPGQEDDFDLASYTCNEQYPVADKYSEPLTETQWRSVYDHYESDVIPCLQSLGYAPDPLPSFESFLATSDSPEAYQIISPGTYRDITEDVQGGRWTTPDDVTQRECQVQPSDDVLYP
ncbi:hypothetical protein [Ornithinimicrobium sp. INDO-MA30-4]|uniref:hypothetical protein n=1 Tax=Ornithinimicrobium sp. INDO-MA30-4 TaxID=2908651 RepID=UPI001F2D0C32|nr:hypothetical protein [Ornithinimicrobium sp. INDO-MA30-4]UJH71103.1 hypothetical protein L0A91_04325 [Ornithinimicrobium sp. INDO-MA30-4]